MAQPVVHFEVVGKDGDKLKSYYAEMFEWEIKDDNPMKYGLVDAAEGLAGARHRRRHRRGPEGYEGHITFYVEVPDVEAALVKAESLGRDPADGPGDDHGGHHPWPVQDPEGNVVGLIQAAS